MTAISDSYITTDTIFETYLTDDPRASAIALKNAEAAIQTWYLQRATKIIDSLPIRGRKYMRDGSQDRQFPREYMTEYGWYPVCDESGEVEVPQAVLDACCEEALAIYDRINSQRLQNQREGIQSQSIAGSSETYVVGAANLYHGLLSKDAYDLLKKYIAHSVPIV